MTPADDLPQIEEADEAWLAELHADPTYRKILDEIDLDDDSPGVPAERVLAWVRSWGTENELPKPEPE